MQFSHIVKRLSSHAKLKLSIVLASAIVLLLAGAAFKAYEFFTVRHGVVSVFEALAAFAGAQAVSHLKDGNTSELERIIRSFELSERVLSAAVVSPQGRVLASYGSLFNEIDREVFNRHERHRFVRNRLYLSIPITPDGSILGRIHVIADVRDMYATLIQLLAAALAVFFICMCVAAWLAKKTEPFVLSSLSGLEKKAVAVLAPEQGRAGTKKSGLPDPESVARAFEVLMGKVARQEETLSAVREDMEKISVEREAERKQLETFSFSVSHDLRAPMRSIEGFSRALLEDYTHSLDEQGRDYLRRLIGSVKRMNKLIDDVLQLTRLSGLELNRKLVNLSALASTIAEDLKQSHPKRRTRFIITPDISGDGDEPLLRILMENLLSNAWKFTSRKDDAEIRFGSVDHKQDVAYFVRDDGAGFDMTYYDRLFSLFQRLHSEHEYPGTGIGLALVQRIVQRHGGRIWATGKPGEGAVFYFTLRS